MQCNAVREDKAMQCFASRAHDGSIVAVRGKAISGTGQNQASHSILESFPEILTPAEVAKICHVSQQTVTTLLRAGKLPGVQVGRKWCIPKNQLIQFLEGGE